MGGQLTGLLLFFCLLSISVKADNLSSRQQIQKDIKVLDSRLSREERKAAALRAEVRTLEQKLGEQTRKAYAIEKKIKQVVKRLDQANTEKKVLEAELKLQKKGLSQQMQALYSAGEQSHLRMLLKQDDPSDIGRTVKYFEYLNRSRIKKIQGIKATLQQLLEVTQRVKKNKTRLQHLQANLLKEKKASQQILEQRERAFKKSNKRVKKKKQQLRELKRKEAKLQSKIERLVAQTARVEPEVKQKKQENKGKKPAKKQQKKQSKQVSSSTFYANKRFSSLRGKLSWPVKGKILHSYGEKRNEKQRWKGTVIAARGGQKVRAIAEGKVEFAGWFTGYGYLVIIRHDNNYRSLYGYNRAVYVRSGQVVKGGAVIAAVGNSGGQQRNALYFEIRKGASPRNPAKWCR